MMSDTNESECCPRITDYRWMPKGARRMHKCGYAADRIGLSTLPVRVLRPVLPGRVDPAVQRPRAKVRAGQNLHVVAVPVTGPKSLQATGNIRAVAARDVDMVAIGTCGEHQCAAWDGHFLMRQPTVGQRLVKGQCCVVTHPSGGG